MLWRRPPQRVTFTDALLPYATLFRSISVGRLRLDLPVTGAFLDACAQAGIAANADYNGASIEGASPLQFNTRYGRRQSAAVGYLSPAMKRRNLHVLANTRVKKIDEIGRAQV